VLERECVVCLCVIYSHICKSELASERASGICERRES